MTITSDNFQITSSDPVGATLATDWDASRDAHYQEVKLNTGADGVGALLGDANPVQGQIKHIVAVAGNTLGTLAVPIEICGGAALTVAGLTMSGGTVNAIVGGTIDNVGKVHSLAGGITIGVASVGAEGITASISGNVLLGTADNNIGNVDVLTVAIPTYGVTSAGVTIDQDSNLARRTLPAGTFETGFRVTNLGPATIYLGNTAATGLTNPSSALAHGYPLLKYGSIFIEASKSESIQCVVDGTGTADIRIFGS